MDEKINNTKNKTEQAEMMEIKMPEHRYWGDYDGNLTKDAIASFEQKLVEKSKVSDKL